MPCAWDEYKAIIVRLDEMEATLPKKSLDFVASLLEDPPDRLSDKQCDWLDDLAAQFLA